MFTVLLLEKGAEVNIQDAIGCSALMKAAECGSSRCIKKLLEAGADANQVCNNGETALFKAARIFAMNRHFCDNLSQFCYEPLFYKAVSTTKNFYHASIASLLQEGADVNICTKNGCNVLYPALKSNIMWWIRK